MVFYWFPPSPPNLQSIFYSPSFNFVRDNWFPLCFPWNPYELPSPLKEKIFFQPPFPPLPPAIKMTLSVPLVFQNLSPKPFNFPNDPPPPSPTLTYNLVIFCLNFWWDQGANLSAADVVEALQYHQICCAMQISFTLKRGCFRAVLCHFAGWKRRRVLSIV